MYKRGSVARSGGSGVDLWVGYAAGAAANTDITVPGIRPTDSLVAVLSIRKPTATAGKTIVSNLTSQTTIVADNTIRISGTSTSGLQVLVFWWKG